MAENRIHGNGCFCDQVWSMQIALKGAKGVKILSFLLKIISFLNLKVLHKLVRVKSQKENC